jgi:GMP synthase (glutamine-hydrolysing)
LLFHAWGLKARANPGFVGFCPALPQGEPEEGRKMRVAIVENCDGTAHGQMGVALHEDGAVIDVLRPYKGVPLPEDFSGYDGIIVFGGTQSARCDAAHPYLPALAEKMRRAVEAGQPLMGICLGAQLLARGFGAENWLNHRPEFGWTAVTPTVAASKDPVLGPLPGDYTPFQWHSDSFALPEGALHLASGGAVAHQAFRVGRAGYGCQFHFEASRAVVLDWARDLAAAIDGIAPAGWRARAAAEAAQNAQAADAAGLDLARRFVALMRG